MLKSNQYHITLKIISLFSDLFVVPVDIFVRPYKIIKERRYFDTSRFYFSKKNNNYKSKKMQNVDSSIFEILEN